MLKFIELHEKETGDSFSVNVDHIISFGKEGIILTGVPRAYALATAESYEEIKQLIHDVGVLIHKPDPRLNLTKPLTMDDLRNMIGEPVWNSNNGKWYLMLKVREDLDPELAVVQDSDAKIEVFSPEELIKFPLYRMNQEIK